MRLIKTVFSSALALSTLHASAQNSIGRITPNIATFNLPCEEIYNEINEIDSNWRVTPYGTSNFDLVTDYTFTRFLNNAFAKVLIGENAFAADNHYAEIKIDKDNSTASFAYNIMRNKADGLLRSFATLGIQASIDNSNVAKVFTKDGFSKKGALFANFNWVLSGNSVKFLGSYDMGEITRRRRCLIDEICQEQRDLIAAVTDDTCKHTRSWLDNKKVWTNPTQYRTRILDNFADYEEKLLTPYLTHLYREWITLSPYAGFQNFQQFNAIDSNVSAKTFFSPSLRLTYNYQNTDLARGTDLYINAWVELGLKTSFTDMDSRKWNHYTKLSDSTQFIDESQDVYTYDSKDFTTRYLPSAGGQLVKFFRPFNFLAGIDVTEKVDFLVPSKIEEHTYVKSVTGVGIVFPFNDKDGNRTVNLEPFYNFQWYSATHLDPSWFLGLKFSVPFGN